MPLVSQTFDQLLDFTRTTSGTFVGSNGLIQNTPASVNLFTQTQQFDNAAWNKNNATVTANAAVAPDGTSTADKLVEDATNNIHRVSQVPTLTAVPHTATIYAKPAGRNWLYMANASLSQAAYFNVSTGVVGTIVGATTATITSVGNGWYRCSITSTPSAGAQNYSFYTASADGSFSYAGDGTSGLFIWGAQLELGSTATTYTRNNGGVFPPRFDYDPVTLAPKGILIEEQRTNLLTYSEQFGSWTNSGAAVTANSIAAPSGETTADTIVRVGFTSDAIYNTATFTGDGVKAVSIWIKKGTSPSALIALLDATASAYRLWADITWSGTTPSLAFTSGSLISSTNYGNGWWRLELATTAVTAANGNRVYIYPGRTGSANGETVYCWGAQAENATFATSYIPTVASQVTRTADQCSIVAPNFAPWYNQSEGTFVAEAVTFTPTASVAGALAYQVNNGSSSFIDAYYTSGNISSRVFVGGASQAAISAGYVVGATEKVALGYKTNDFAAARNGVLVGTDTSGTVPTNIDRMGIGGSPTPGTGLFPINGYIRSIRYYPTRLTNAQLQALTA